jgi:hypothetical protein
LDQRNWCSSCNQGARLVYRWVQDEWRTGAGVYGQSVGRRLSFSLGRHATVFQAEIYAILACVYEIQLQNRSEKYVSTCSNSQAALKALKAVRTTSPLVQQCQKALNDISTRYAVGLYWVPGHAGPEPALGVSRRDIQNKLNPWLVNQHCAKWRSLGDTQRQAWELISGPGLGAKTKVMSFNRAQSRAVIGLLTGHNTLRRHLYLLGLQDSPLCRKCGVMEGTRVFTSSSVTSLKLSLCNCCWFGHV